MNRRNFIAKGLMATGASLMKSQSLFAGISEEFKLTILHTNDVHSHLEPFPNDGSKLAGLGGVAERSKIIDDVRKECANVLLLDSGDMFQGTPYFNMFKGEAEIKAMSQMGYDASTLGNHDFDGGMENLAHQLQHANFPILNCNYVFKETPLAEKVLPYKVFQKGKATIGVFGIGIELDGLVPANLYGKTLYRNPIENANTTARFLKENGCDLIICLSHLGDKYEDEKVSDEVLAKENSYIDLILGGHTHRFFKEPLVYKNKAGGTTLVNQVGWAGIVLGRIDISFDWNRKWKKLKNHNATIRGKL